jgi:transposase
LSKLEILKENGTYNKRHASVKKAEFMEGGFYDPRDIVQVKYEMLRDAEDSNRAISTVSGDFGFSRTAFYSIKESFEKNGITALFPDKPGPRQPHKLTKAVQELIEKHIETNPNASATEIAATIQREKGIQINKRTIERYTAKKKPL